MKTIALIEKGKDGTYGIFTPNLQSCIIGDGKTVDEAKADFENSVREVLNFYFEEKIEIPKELQNITFEYKYDIVSFFNYFDWINVSKFSKRAKINSSPNASLQSRGVYFSKTSSEN
jgi:predicted RNase H-like HicB family nuclease